jgi:hypothetical protein
MVNTHGQQGQHGMVNTVKMACLQCRTYETAMHGTVLLNGSTWLKLAQLSATMHMLMSLQPENSFTRRVRAGGS